MLADAATSPRTDAFGSEWSFVPYDAVRRASAGTDRLDISSLIQPIGSPASDWRSAVDVPGVRRGVAECVDSPGTLRLRPAPPDWVVLPAPKSAVGGGVREPEPDALLRALGAAFRGKVDALFLRRDPVQGVVDVFAVVAEHDDAAYEAVAVAEDTLATSEAARDVFVHVRAHQGRPVQSAAPVGATRIPLE